MSDAAASTIAPDSIAVFHGGVEIAVTHRDGRSESVLVRELNFEQVPQYAQILGEPEDKVAALFSGRPAEWINSLTRESVVAIVVQGEELNLPFTVGWMQRANARQSKIVGALGLDQQNEIVKAVLSRLAASSPTSAQ